MPRLIHHEKVINCIPAPASTNSHHLSTYRRGNHPCRKTLSSPLIACATNADIIMWVTIDTAALSTIITVNPLYSANIGITPKTVLPSLSDTHNHLGIEQGGRKIVHQSRGETSTSSKFEWPPYYRTLILFLILCILCVFLQAAAWAPPTTA